MSPEQAKELLPIFTAFANGEKIEYNSKTAPDVWLPDPYPTFDIPAHRYRIAKPKPMYRVARMLSYNKKGIHLIICYAYQDIKEVETSTCFKGWITDWIEYDNQLP